MQSLKSKIDSLWLEFHSGGITNPITVIEQISYLMFLRLIDLNESRQENRAKRLGKDYNGLFGPEQQHLRWQNFKQAAGADMLKLVRDQVFPFLRDDVAKRSALGKYLSDANCMIPTGNLLVRAVNAIEALPLEKGDTKGDLYEYLLSKLQTAGIAGQFRTPRHIIRAMVELIDPQPTETICDPACGTAGFHVGAMDHLKRKYSTPDLVEEDADGEKHYPGDLLEPHREHIQTSMFYGYDFDSTMLRIAAMNLLLHDVQSRTLHNQDTLVSTAILVFRKGGRTDEVWFYDVLGDGYSLDDKRTPAVNDELRIKNEEFRAKNNGANLPEYIEKDNLPDLLHQWNGGQPKTQDQRTKYFTVPAAEIRENNYDLSINRYKEVAYEAVAYDPPKKILGQLKSLEREILKDIHALEEML